MSSAWKFGRREPACHVCAATFDDGERIWSRLRLAGEGLERQDVCWRCWEPAPEPAAGETGEPRETGEPGETAGAGDVDVFWWRTRHVVGKRRGLGLNLPALEALFHSIEGRTEETVRELRYLLCLLLMRKRRLKLVRVQRGADGESFEVRRPRRQESLRVDVFDFTPERMDELRVELLALFDSAEGLDEGSGEVDAADGSASSEVDDGAREPNGDPAAEASPAG